MMVCPWWTRTYFYYLFKERFIMPIVNVKMLEGRSDEQKRALIEKVTDVIVETTGAPAERVTVVIDEMKKTNLGIAGKRPSDA